MDGEVLRGRIFHKKSRSYMYLFPISVIKIKINYNAQLKECASLKGAFGEIWRHFCCANWMAFVGQSVILLNDK